MGLPSFGRESRGRLHRGGDMRAATAACLLAAGQAGWLGQACVAAPPAAAPAKASPTAGNAFQQPPLGSQWVRLKTDAGGEPLAMDVAVVRYEDDADPPRTVDLVGAVHIGDRGYYRELNRRFRQYDAVLYELVAPQGTVVPKGAGARSDHPLGALQNGLKSMLEVEHQLEQIDYTRPNFVHADLSGDEFLKSMTDRNESFFDMYMKIVGASLAQQSQQAAEGESAELDMFGALFSDDRARQLKIAMAKQFEGMETLMVGLAGPGGSTLITARNTRALDVLEQELADGKRKLAIFYGAGHLEDMHKQLTERFDFRPASIEWLTAWDLRKK